MGVVSLVSPNRVSLPRFHVRIGLHIVLFEACSAFTCVAACTLARSPYVVTAIRRLQTLRLLHACSGRFRLERSPGGACTHWKSAALSRRTWKTAIADLRKTATSYRTATANKISRRNPTSHSKVRIKGPGNRPRLRAPRRAPDQICCLSDPGRNPPRLFIPACPNATLTGPAAADGLVCARRGVQEQFSWLSRFSNRSTVATVLRSLNSMGRDPSSQPM